MEIVRKKLVQNRLVNVNDIIEQSELVHLTTDDIAEDHIVSSEVLDATDFFLVFQNNVSDYEGERYCYLKIRTHVGGDETTKAYEIKKVITDINLVDIFLFERIFRILFLRKSDPLTANRIVVGKYNERFSCNSEDLACKIAKYIFGCYNTYTSEDCPTYTISNSFLKC